MNSSDELGAKVPHLLVDGLEVGLVASNVRAGRDIAHQRELARSGPAISEPAGDRIALVHVPAKVRVLSRTPLIRVIRRRTR